MRNAVVGVIATLCLSISPAFAQASQLAITHVTVIDPRDGSTRNDATVLIKGVRIAQVGRHVVVPRSARVIDASGKYLVPGFWDMHVHIGSVESAKAAFPALIANGITGVRDMGTPLTDAIEIRTAARHGDLPGLEVFVAGPLLNGPLPFKTPLILSVGTPEESRLAVDKLHAFGVDFIKVHDALPALEYDAIASECRKIGIPFAGHVPPSVTAEHASEAGQRSIEHLGGRFYGVLLACSADEAAITNRIRDVVSSALASMTAGKEADDSVIFRAEITRPLVETFDSDKASHLIARFRRKGTWQCPTLVSLPLRSALADRTDLSDEDRRWGKRLLEKIDSVVSQLATKNADVLAGTDAPLATPRLHEELALLVAAGMTPLQALQAATVNPARFFGRTGDFGSVSRGRIANLVVLDANPLTGIRNTRRVSGVLVRGLYFDSNSSQVKVKDKSKSVRQGLEKWYARNTEAFRSKDLAAVMALRTEDFQTTTPDVAIKGRSCVRVFRRYRRTVDPLSPLRVPVPGTQPMRGGSRRRQLLHRVLRPRTRRTIGFRPRFPLVPVVLGRHLRRRRLWWCPIQSGITRRGVGRCSSWRHPPVTARSARVQISAIRDGAFTQGSFRVHFDNVFVNGPGPAPAEISTLSASALWVLFLLLAVAGSALANRSGHF